jgi:hypothetical protein
MWVIASLTRWCDLGSCNTVITDGAGLTCAAPPQQAAFRRRNLLASSPRTSRRLLESGGSLYVQCDTSAGGAGCAVGSKCGYNPSAKKFSGSFLDFNPHTNDGCCAFSKGLVETGAHEMSVAWCKSDSETSPASDDSNPEEVSPCIKHMETLRHSFSEMTILRGIGITFGNN